MGNIHIQMGKILKIVKHHRQQPVYSQDILNVYLPMYAML